MTLYPTLWKYSAREGKRRPGRAALTLAGIVIGVATVVAVTATTRATGRSYRAMFEAQAKNRMGVLLWMSHPCWPSMVWQTYDYYFDQSGGYFGSKKGSEPLHIQWNPVTDSVEVVNYSGGSATSLTAQAEILNMDGSRQWEKSAALDPT